VTEVLRKKLVRLVRGEEGVALVVTLALFMFLYVSCAGVYTVGKAVKERIILQNAVDAAAYSAAVVQADYLSRIATINRAMAWTYKAFVTTQMNWISRRFLEGVADAYDGLYPAVADDIRDGLAGVHGAVLFRGKGPPRTRGEIAKWLDETSTLDSYEGELSGYGKNLDDKYGAICMLANAMQDEMERISGEVLKANLPWRQGELCRYKISGRGKKLQELLEEGFLSEMRSEEEKDFLDFDDPAKTSEFLGEKDLMTILSEAFRRSYADRSLYANFEYHVRGTAPGAYVPYSQKGHLGIWAEDYKGDDPGDAFDGHRARPLILGGGYFYNAVNEQTAQGAITVAVAKWNENPWKGLLRDLTGIHAAFDHAEGNDWTIAIASAQAALRSGGDDSRDEPREYSLNGDGSTVDLDNPDWDAVYLPVRMAFDPKSDDFKDWLTTNTDDDKDKWKKVVDDNDRKYVKELEDIKFYELNDAALPRMHNNVGANKVLQWNCEGRHKFLDLMYH